MFHFLFAIVLLGIAALFIWRGVSFGKRYTWIYSAARAVSVIVAVLLSVLLSALLAKLFAGIALRHFVFGELLKEVPTLADAIVALVAMVLAPWIFYGLFFIVKGICCKISTPIAKKLFEGGKKVPTLEPQGADTDFAESVSEQAAEVEAVQEEKSEEKSEEKKPSKKKKKAKKRDALRVPKGKPNPWGMVVGGLCGLLLFVAVMSPAIGMLSTANDVLGMTAALTDHKAIDLAADATDGVANNVGAKAVKVCGGNAIYAGLTTYRVGENKVSLQKEMMFLSASTQAVATYRNASMASGEVAYSLRQVADAFDETSLIPTLVPDFLSAANEEWEAGNSFHGIKRINLGGALSAINEPVLHLLATSDYDTVKGDVHSGLEILAKTVENGGLRGGKSGKALLMDETVTEGIMLELLKNPHLSPLIGDVMEYGFDQVGHKIDAHFDGDAEEDTSVQYASMDQIMIDSSHVEQLEREAKILAKMLNQTLSLAESMGNGFSAATCIRDVGPILDTLAESETVGEESTAIFLTCILQAGKVYDEVGFTLKDATELADTITESVGKTNADGTVNTYARMMGSVSNAVLVVQASSNQDQYHDTMDDLMADLTPSSAKVLSQMMSTSVMEKHGVSGESAEPTSNLISSIFTNLADEREAGMPEDEYQRESNAVMNLTDLAMNAGTEGTNGTFGEGSATGVSADEFVGNILDSKVVSGSMKEQVFADGSEEPTIDPLKKNKKLSEKDADEMSQALTTRWTALSAEKQQDPETVKTYQAIGAMVGMTVEFTPDSVVLG